MDDYDDRLVSIIHADGDAADEILARLTPYNYVEVILELAQWDYGDETVMASLSNMHTRTLDEVYDGETQWRYGDYYLHFHRGLSYVELMRRLSGEELEDLGYGVDLT